MTEATHRWTVSIFMGFGVLRRTTSSYL
jgi:hypothetical protein